MHRRNLLKASMAIAAYTGLSATGLLAAQAWASNGTADGEAQAFDFEALKAQAKQLASNRYQAGAAAHPGDHDPAELQRHSL